MAESASDPISGAAYNVRGVESFGALLAFELDCIALVQSLISVLLNSGEVYKDVLTSGTLDKPISFGSVEPLDHAIFLQANSLSHFVKHLKASLETHRAAASVYGKSWLTWNALRDETITLIGLPSLSNRELPFELHDVMAGIGIECKRNLPAGATRGSLAIKPTVGRL
jgi:hypothetical protein